MHQTGNRNEQHKEPAVLEFNAHHECRRCTLGNPELHLVRLALESRHVQHMGAQLIYSIFEKILCCPVHEDFFIHPSINPCLATLHTQLAEPSRSGTVDVSSEIPVA